MTKIGKLFRARSLEWLWLPVVKIYDNGEKSVNYFLDIIKDALISLRNLF
jgi:hypothetical protein